MNQTDKCWYKSKGVEVLSTIMYARWSRVNRRWKYEYSSLRWPSKGGLALSLSGPKKSSSRATMQTEAIAKTPRNATATEQDVDRFVAARVKPELRDVVVAIRALMKKHAPRARLGMSYGVPVWKGKHILAVISPTKQGITFAFSHGAAFDDKYGLLQGVGKVSMHVKIASLAEINESRVRYYIKQAVQFDEK
jgi:hypothetical protein